MREIHIFTANDGTEARAVLTTEKALGAYDLPGYIGRATAMDVAHNNLRMYRDNVFNDCPV